MTTQSPPIVSLQAPKDVSLSEIEAELSKIWQSYGTGEQGTPAATRATTFSLVVYEPEETQQLLTALGFYSGPIDGIPGPRTAAALREAQKAYGLERTGKASAEVLARLRTEVVNLHGSVASGEGKETSSTSYALDTRSPSIADAIASRNPCRIIALCPVAEEDAGVTAQVSAYCPVKKQSSTTLICCEYITLKGTVAALERVGGVVTNLLIGGLPKFLWWKAMPDPANDLFKRLAAVCNTVVVDSSEFSETEIDLLRLQELIEAGTPVADLNWRRLSAWQELTAETFDPPERRAALKEVDRVTIDYEKGNPAQALMFLGWLASRLQWYPSHIEQGSSGEVRGNLVALRLNSTNLDADCCTVLCSETTGCMRMESGGGAQSCRFQQVTSPVDQNAELLLSQQLQRWGHEALYEESLAVTAKILRLGKEE